MLGLLREQLKDELPLALYCLPGEEVIRAVLQSDAELISDVKGTLPGFGMTPFDPASGPALKIRPDFLYQAPLGKRDVTYEVDLPAEDPAP